MPEALKKENAILALNKYFLLKHKLVIGATLCVLVIALLVAVGGSRGKDSAPSSPPLPGVEVAGGEQQAGPVPSGWMRTPVTRGNTGSQAHGVGCSANAPLPA